MVELSSRLNAAESLVLVLYERSFSRTLYAADAHHAMVEGVVIIDIDTLDSANALTDLPVSRDLVLPFPWFLVIRATTHKAPKAFLFRRFALIADRSWLIRT